MEIIPLTVYERQSVVDHKSVLLVFLPNEPESLEIAFPLEAVVEFGDTYRYIVGPVSERYEMRPASDWLAKDFMLRLKRALNSALQNA